MSNPIPPIVPLPEDDDSTEEVPMQEVDGREVLDPDIDETLIDSAAADRLASGADLDEEEDLLKDDDLYDDDDDAEEEEDELLDEDDDVGDGELDDDILDDEDDDL